MSDQIGTPGTPPPTPASWRDLLASGLKLLDGRKTYIAAALAVLAAGYAAWSGDWPETQRYIVLALGFAGLRHAIQGAPLPPGDVAKVE